jgi:hypothetical protein
MRFYLAWPRWKACLRTQAGALGAVLALCFACLAAGTLGALVTGPGPSCARLAPHGGPPRACQRPSAHQEASPP